MNNKIKLENIEGLPTLGGRKRNLKQHLKDWEDLLIILLIISICIILIVTLKLMLKHP